MRGIRFIVVSRLAIPGTDPEYGKP